ncbi:MAG: CysB family HTH-type transcriptional regulator [Rhodocyclaceae bacterium]
MNLQQLRYLNEIARRRLNVSEAAAALFTSQPGVSKQIKLLEEELGITIFTRSGKRLTGLTEAGRQVLDIAGRILQDIDNLKHVGEAYASEVRGTLTVATTHTQARYKLPAVVKRFIERYPHVRLHLHQGNPPQVVTWLTEGEADIGIATESLDRAPQLVTMPCYQWSHLIVVLNGHPLLQQKEILLAQLAEWPLITYDPTFTGRTKIDQAFERAGLSPNIALTAVDSDVIKTYVELGLGVGIIAEMAFEAQRDVTLSARPTGHLFGSNTTRLAIRRGAWLRPIDFAFIEMFAPHLTKEIVLATLRGEGEDCGL